VHVISRKALADFWAKHARAKSSLTGWYKVVENASFLNFSDIRGTFNSADKVGKFVVFDVGDGFRIVTAVHFNRGKLYIRHVFTHPEYDRWTDRQRQGR
jgi:mRNA interferase HigB